MRRAVLYWHHRRIPVLVMVFVASTMVLDVPTVHAEPGTLHLASTTATGEKGNGASWTPATVNGTTIAFVSYATNLDSRDTDDLSDIYVKDLVSGVVQLVSVRSDGLKGNGSSFNPAISKDGTTVVFSSMSTNLDPGDTEAYHSVYLKDLVSGQLTLVSRGSDGANANSWVGEASLSGDVTKIAFLSDATNLTPEDTDHYVDAFVKDLSTGTVRMVSTDAGGMKAYGSFSRVKLSTDGSRVVFDTTASMDSRDVDTWWDVYAKDLSSGEVFLADTTQDGRKADHGAFHGAISGDGTKVAFDTFASNLDPADTDPDDDHDVYVKNLETGALTLASRGWSLSPTLSGDGTRVAFESNATDLHPSDSDSYRDVYVRDLRTGAVMLASTTTDGRNVPAGDAHFGVISADGTRVAFHVDQGGYLDPRDADSATDVYVKDLTAPPSPANHPPDCSAVGATPNVIFPPARPQFALVRLGGATDRDDDPISYSITGVSQDEPVVTKGDATTPDARAAGGDSVEVRAEFNPQGDGRVYRVAYEVSDGRGGTCAGTARVGVPRGRTGSAIDSGSTYDSLG